MRYNQFIFSSLVERKSIYIEKIGVVSVVRRGSSKSDSKNFRELPRYDLIVTVSAYDISLKEAVEGDYDAWFNSVCKSGKGGRELMIPNCFHLKTGNDGAVTIIPCGELALLLNPFSEVKSKSKSVSMILVVLLIIIVLSGGGYAAYFYGFIPSIGREVEKVTTTTTVPKLEEKVVFEVEQPAVTDTMSMVEPVLDSVPDRVEVVEPKSDEKSGFTEPVNGNSYLVAGSFGDLSSARSDAKRLEKIYVGMKVYTTTKRNGDYINYLLTTNSYEDAIEAQKEFVDKFEKIKGIWVYYMK